MTTPAIAFTPRRTRPGLGLWRYLLKGQFSRWYYLDRREAPEEVWAEHRDVVLTHYIKRHPGHRPFGFWEFEVSEPRRRLGGTGDPINYNALHHGVPMYWCVDRFDHGVPLSDDDPPMFESEPRYLKRLGLLLPEERRRLKRSDFNPVVIRRCGKDRIGLYWA
jgi:hypothetical protein